MNFEVEECDEEIVAKKQGKKKIQETVEYQIDE